MSKHTPGPWFVIERANGQAFSVACQVQTKGNFLTTHYIANVVDMATPQAEATANLIAAAPQMLEALETWSNLTGFETDEEMTAAGQMMEAALRAAKGAKK